MQNRNTAPNKQEYLSCKNTQVVFVLSLQVLFLKNLSAKVKREDLVALFNRYHTNSSEKIDYKLMTGRMKGQAFVTFQSKLYRSFFTGNLTFSDSNN